MFFVTKVQRQLQKFPISIGVVMSSGLSYFLAGVQTSTDIEELSLKTPRPVATTE